MATFESQVEGLTGLSIDGSSSPTQTELSQYLKDGVIDVTFRSIATQPQEIQNFQRVSAIKDANNNFRLNGARILAVLREATADGSSDGSPAWRPCRLIPPALESRVVDPDSLEFASVYNPVYMIGDDGYINVYPTPDGTNDGFKIYYVNNVPVDKSGAALLYSHSDIGYFADDKVRLVVLYAAIKALGNHLSALIMPLDIEEIFFSPIEPITYDDSTEISAGSSGQAGAGAYPAGTITPPTAATAGSWEDMLKGLVRPTYVKPTLPDDFQATITTFIDTEEDIELSAAKQKQQQLVIEEYKMEIQNELNRYNMENTAYQKEVDARLLWFNSAKEPSSATKSTTAASAGGVSITTKGEGPASSTVNVAKAQLDFQRELQERTLKIQKYAAEVQKIGAEYQIFQARQSALIQEYNQAFGAKQAPPAQQEARRQ